MPAIRLEQLKDLAVYIQFKAESLLNPSIVLDGEEILGYLKRFGAKIINQSSEDFAIFFCKNHFGISFHCPVNYKGFNFGIGEGEHKRFLFNVNGYEKPYSFIFLYQENSNFMNQLELYSGIEFTEKDFVGAEVSKSFAIQKLLEHHGHNFVTNGSFAEEIFDIKWDKKECLDVTPNSFKLNETFTAEYLFRKALKEPQYQEVDGRFERLEPIFEIVIKSRVYATIEFSIKEGKLSIELSNIKTKLSKFGRTIPVDTAFFTRNVDTNKFYTYKNEGMKFMVSVLENRSSFKKMLDAHVFLGPYKQFILKHLVADIYRSHQHITLVSLAKEQSEMV